MTTPVLIPADELVCCAWLAANVPGLTPASVAPQLPSDVTASGQPAPWVTSPGVFVTAVIVGGAPDENLPVSRTVFQIDVWATVAGSNKPPWNRAQQFAAQIRTAAWNRRSYRQPLGVITPTGQPCGQAAVLAVKTLTSPRRMPDDPGDYARVTLDLELDWITLGQVID